MSRRALHHRLPINAAALGVTFCQTFGWAIVAALFLMPAPACAGDWPQFMHDSTHSGNAADEALQLPLGLVAQVKLDDAVMTSPAVVGGRVYVVDQMGTAYCVDVDAGAGAGRIVWKAEPDGELAMGSNTSSPCVTGGRVYFGTTAGRLHILDARDGRLIRTIAMGWPVTASPVFANGRVFCNPQVNGMIYCFEPAPKD